MNQNDPYSNNKKKAGRKSIPSPARKVGYVVVVIIMIAVLYLVRNYEKWHLPFLTSEFSRCLFYIELSIYSTIAAQVLFLFYDNRWFRHLIQVLTGIAGALSIIMIYVIFPFDFDGAHWVKWIRIGLLIIFGLSIIGILVDLIKGIRYLLREPEAL